MTVEDLRPTSMVLLGILPYVVIVLAISGIWVVHKTDSPNGTAFGTTLFVLAIWLGWMLGGC